MNDNSISAMIVLMSIAVVMTLIGFVTGILHEREFQKESFQQLCQSARVKFVRHTEPTNWVECVRYRVEKID